MKLYKFFVLLFLATLQAQNYEVLYTTLSCVLHIHSEFSGSRYTIDDIYNLAKDNKIDSVILTDHFMQKVEYGFWPFRSIVKKMQKCPSVMDNLEKYLTTIRNINNLQKEVIIIPSLEVTPHYYWEVDRENNLLIIKNFHKHMLLLNLTDLNTYKSLPVIGNELNYAKFNILSFWPLIVFAISLFLKSKFLFVISLIFLIANFPFKKYYDQYHNYGEHPYQQLIDFVNKKNFTSQIENNMLIIWAHPEATNYEKVCVFSTVRKIKIGFQTLPYYNSMFSTYDYDGFSIFAEGYRETGGISGVWDKILLEYCLGKREKPVWCFSELDFGETEGPIDLRKNILFVREKNYKEVIKALKFGNFYSVWRYKDKELQLSNFKLNRKEAIFGEKYKLNENIINISFDVKWSNDENKEGIVYIIKNGEVVYKKQHLLPAKIEFNEPKPKSFSYYRVYIESQYPNKLATNPIFIE